MTVQPIPFLHRRFQTESTDWLTRTTIFTLTLPGYQQPVTNHSLIATTTLRVHRPLASNVHCTSFILLQRSFPAAEESSGRLIRTPMVDEEIDYDSMSLRSKNRHNWSYATSPRIPRIPKTPPIPSRDPLLGNRFPPLRNRKNRGIFRRRRILLPTTTVSPKGVTMKSPATLPSRRRNARNPREITRRCHVMQRSR